MVMWGHRHTSHWRTWHLVNSNNFATLAANLGYWHQRADERHGNPPQGNQELLVVRDKVGRPRGELGISKSMECDIFPIQCFDTVGWAIGRASGL